MEENYPQYVTKEAIISLTEKLHLPQINSQDWEFEVGKSKKVFEYISFYENVVLNKEEKFALMIVIISSYNEALLEGIAQKELWNKIKYNILKDMDIHRNTIEYWALDDEDLEDCFAITPLIRSIVE